MRSRATALALAGLAMHLVLRLDPTWLPPGLRLALAFAALVLVPGAALVSLTRAPAGGMLLAAPWALGMGVAWCGAAILFTRALGLPFTGLVTWLLPVHAALWLAAWSRWPRGEEPAGVGAPAP